MILFIRFLIRFMQLQIPRRHFTNPNARKLLCKPQHRYQVVAQMSSPPVSRENNCSINSTANLQVLFFIRFIDILYMVSFIILKIENLLSRKFFKKRSSIEIPCKRAKFDAFCFYRKLYLYFRMQVGSMMQMKKMRIDKCRQRFSTLPII